MSRHDKGIFTSIYIDSVAREPDHRRKTLRRAVGILRKAAFTAWRAAGEVETLGSSLRDSSWLHLEKEQQVKCPGGKGQLDDSAGSGTCPQT